MKVIDYAKHKGMEEDLIFDCVADLLNDRLTDAVGVYGCDLHNHIFNEDPAFIYTNKAESAVDSVGVWSAIRLVHKYEADNFGESNTEIEPCKVANMLTYIYGEFLLAQVECLTGKMWDRKLTESDIKKIARELRKWAKENLPTGENHFKQPLDAQVWEYYGSY